MGCERVELSYAQCSAVAAAAGFVMTVGLDGKPVEVDAQCASVN